VRSLRLRLLPPRLRLRHNRKRGLRQIDLKGLASALALLRCGEDWRNVPMALALGLTQVTNSFTQG